MIRSLRAAAALCATAATLAAQLALSSPFADHMVLPHGRAVTVRGTAPAGAAVEVTFAGERAAAVAAGDGTFAATLPALAPSAAGRELVVRARHGDAVDAVTLTDVVCGEVYLCAGQSNMRWPVARAAEADELLAAAELPGLRLLDLRARVDHGAGRWDLATSRELAADNYYTTAGWQRSTAATAKPFSAVAFVFGRRMHLALGVPVGLVHGAIGGSPMEAWLSPATVQGDPELAAMATAWWDGGRYPTWARDRARLNLGAWLDDPQGDRPHHPFEPTFLYEAGIAPLADFPFAGVIWYQGESNADQEPRWSAKLFRAVIADFRVGLAAPELPFWFVQLPGLNRDWERFREVQREVARTTPGVGMAVAIDLGHPTDVHPRRKAPVGERLAALASASAYGLDVVAGGPLFRDVTREGRRLRVRFAQAAGLRAGDGGPVRGFELAGPDRVFHPALAVIDGTDVVVGAAAVAAPAAVRYAFADDPDGNLVNGALLPAEPFRTDAWDDATSAAGDAGDGEDRTSFEAAPVGELRRYDAPIGVFEAAAGHAEISASYAHSGGRCLRLFGGDEQTVALTPRGTGPRQLSFRAERWTRQQPFAFRVEAERDGAFAVLYDGSAELRVGARFLSHVRVEVPDGVTALRFCSTAPDGTGVLIDDLRLAAPAPMRLIDVGHAAWTAPALHGCVDNPVTRIDLLATDGNEPVVVVACTLALLDGTNVEDLAGVRLYGTTGVGFATDRPFAAGASPDATRITGRYELQPGPNALWIAVELAPEVALDRRVGVRCESIELADGTIVRPAGDARAQRVGVVVRAAGQDGCHTTRIPGLVTTAAGTLLAVYDNRYRGAGDLPGDIDVGASRSTDGGRTWSPMQVVLDMGDDPAFRSDGVGDPAVLVDRRTGTIWVAAIWSHGDRAWNGSGPGLEPTETGQLVLARSDDDGVTWSPPVNVTRQVKDPAWRLLLQGPGAGITTRDGTLVFAAQYRSADDSPHGGRPFSTILWSQDRGATWHVGSGVVVDTTEAQVVELGDGRLMLNCRDNRGGARAVYTTDDLGRTWEAHPSTRHALPEPVCMASLLRLEHETHGPLLLFSNPATRAGRRDMTLKLSRDDGMTWPLGSHALYDQREGFGYSCLAPVGDAHVGVLYEGRRELYFLRVALGELLGR